MGVEAEVGESGAVLGTGEAVGEVVEGSLVKVVVLL